MIEGHLGIHSPWRDRDSRHHILGWHPRQMHVDPPNYQIHIQSLPVIPSSRRLMAPLGHRYSHLMTISVTLCDMLPRLTHWREGSALQRVCAGVFHLIKHSPFSLFCHRDDINERRGGDPRPIRDDGGTSWFTIRL